MKRISIVSMPDSDIQEGKAAMLDGFDNFTVVFGWHDKPN